MFAADAGFYGISIGPEPILTLWGGRPCGIFRACSPENRQCTDADVRIRGSARVISAEPMLVCLHLACPRRSAFLFDLVTTSLMPLLPWLAVDACRPAPV